MRPGERQVAPDVSGIRRDHVARYEYAARELDPGSRVVDLACGVGYGARVLAQAGHRVTAIDIDDDAIAYAREHYGHIRIQFRQGDASSVDLAEADAAVCFETIEHIADPRALLNRLRVAPRLIASVPNERVFPWRGHAFHVRHYTKEQFEALLLECGWRVTRWLGQLGPQSDVEEGIEGRTLVADAERVDAALAEATRKHIAILGLGPSINTYLEITKRLGSRHRFCDEVWAINALGNVFDCDLVFHMDDVRIQEIRGKARPDSNIAAMLPWLKASRVPVMTSRAHPEYPALVEFPLADVLNAHPCGYFNSTAAYAIAYAIHVNAWKVTVFGNDFTYPNAHDAEKGRACVEFWLGIAHAKGIELSMPKTTSLMDALSTQAERFYGYDCVDLDIRRDDGRIVVDFKERDALPTADEIEARYDHSVHPNPLVSE